MTRNLPGISPSPPSAFGSPPDTGVVEQDGNILPAA